MEDLFVIAESDTSGIAYLETVKDLEGYYGEYTLTVKVSFLTNKYCGNDALHIVLDQ